jgi:hypothetical protein
LPRLEIPYLLGQLVGSMSPPEEGDRP